MSVLENLKDLLEVDVEETIFDAQLLLYANAGITFLKNNAIPVTKIDSNTHSNEWELVDDDYNIVLAWLHLYCLQRFDRTLMTNAYSTTVNWIDNEMTNLIYQLKVRYDHEK